MWAEGMKGGLSQVVRGEHGWGGCVGTGEVEREPSLHHPSGDSSAVALEKKLMINAKVTAIP